MIALYDRNVNHLLAHGVELIERAGVPIAPRGIPTLEVGCPVTSTYAFPTERILFDSVRDANPFFHFIEGLWILAGRNDVATLAKYNRRMAEYSDDSLTFHGAYGHRLRRCGMDQLIVAIQKFRKDPETRQVVLQIWDKGKDLGAETKDMPCNDLIFLKIRNGALNMTVCNRSNDIIWGCYGANAVHFSMLQEYLASMIGVAVGEYTQFSDSFHVYPDNPQWEKLKDHLNSSAVEDPYEHGIRPQPLIDDPESFDFELSLFFEHYDIACKTHQWKNSIFPGVAIPMRRAWEIHKGGCNGAHYAATITADDWRLACLEWLARRGDHTMFKNWGVPEDLLFLRGHRARVVA